MNTSNEFYTLLLNKFKEVLTENSLMDEFITITGKVLTPEEALGKPDRRDFPLLTGKERLMEAESRVVAGRPIPICRAVSR